jgi:hypothetical protein
MPYIVYSGIGAKESEIHTIEEFLSIVLSKEALEHYYEITHYGIDTSYKNYNLPNDFLNFTIEDWMEYTGAIYYDSDW